MAGTSMPGGLSERLRKRREEDEKRIGAERQRLEALITSEFGKLGEHVSSAAASAQNSIENDLEAVVDRQRSVLQWSWGLPLAAGSGLFVLILLGNWALTQWLSIGIRSRIETREELDREIGERTQVLEQLDEATWGIRLHEEPAGKYIVLPAGAFPLDGRDQPQTLGWTVGGQPAIKLSLP